MVVAVAITVVVLALVVSGYWLNSDFKVQRQGMLQVYSAPTGASVEVDGDTLWLQRTNTSKVLPSGEHSVTLTKDGYDTWHKTITVRDGLLYRLHYPRLFLLERAKETVYDTTTTTFATVSPNRKMMLLAGDTTEWTLLRLDADKIRASKIDISQLFSAVSLAEGAETGLFAGRIVSANWSHSNNQILFEVESEEHGREWAVLDVRNPASSVNLTRQFAAEFTEVRIADDSASVLLAVRGGNLHRIDTASRQVSAVLLEQVSSYDAYESEIVYLAKGQLGVFKIGDSSPTVLDPVFPPQASSAAPTDAPVISDSDTDVATPEAAPAPAQVFTTKFYDERYIIAVYGNEIAVYTRDDFVEIFRQTLSFAPESVRVGEHGSFIFMASGTSLATLDMEAMLVREWSPVSESYGWLTGTMIYAVGEGDLSVYDFDGLNHRRLAGNVSAHFPATITDDRWLYYFSDGTLMREWLVEK